MADRGGLAPERDGGDGPDAARRSAVDAPERPGSSGPVTVPPLLGGLADAVPHLVWVASADGVSEYSGRIAAYAGLRDASGAGWDWEAMVHPDDLASTVTAWNAALASRGTYEHEHRLAMADGSHRWHLSRGIPMPDPASGRILWFGTATDIDDGRQAEERLRRTQSALALAMRGGQIGWWQRDLTMEEVTWSPELEELFGLAPGTFAGHEGAFLDFVHDDDLPALNAAVARAIESAEDYVIEFRFRHADGSWRWMEGRGRATFEHGRATFLHGIGMDITARKENEAAIRASEERLRLAIEVGAFGLYDVNLATGTTYWSPELRQMLDVGVDAAPPTTGIPVHRDDRKSTTAMLEAAQAPLSDGVFDHEFRTLPADGSTRWLAVHGQTFFSQPEPSPDRRALRSVGVVVDITERKQADELRDVFVGMLSHELRTPVTSIYGGSQVLRRGHVDEATRQEIIDDIVTESERLERLVENLLVLARAERHATLGGHDPVLIRPVLVRILEDKRRRWPDATLELEVEPGLPPVIGDEGSVELVLRNLISNALKYGPRTGTVSIDVRRAGEFVEVAVTDEGPGVSEAEVRHLFDLFYRTDDARRHAQGAGIGLFVVRALVEAAGGRVEAANRPSGGAEFRFTLPIFVESDSDALLD
jgi:PAS domain S-box-containing protein